MRAPRHLYAAFYTSEQRYQISLIAIIISIELYRSIDIALEFRGPPSNECPKGAANAHLYSAS